MSGTLVLGGLGRGLYALAIGLCAAAAGVMTDIPAGERWAGAPAKPVRKFFREVAAITRLADRDARGDSNAE